MAWEDDVLQAAKELVEKSQKQMFWLGTVTNLNPVQVMVHGSTIAIPCISLATSPLSVDSQVLICQVGPQYYIIGAIGSNPVPESYAETLLASQAVNSAVLEQIMTVYLPSAGTYVIDASISYGMSVADDVTFQFGFGGTIGDNGRVSWIQISTTGTADAVHDQQALNTNFNMGTGQNQTFRPSGMFIASSAGSFIFSASRDSGTLTLWKGSNIQLRKVA